MFSAFRFSTHSFPLFYASSLCFSGFVESHHLLLLKGFKKHFFKVRSNRRDPTLLDGFPL